MEIDEKHVARWWKRLKKCIKEMPEGIELVIDGNNYGTVYKEGALHERHLGSDHDGYGMTEEYFECGRLPGVYPYGEGQ